MSSQLLVIPFFLAVLMSYFHSQFFTLTSHRPKLLFATPSFINNFSQQNFFSSCLRCTTHPLLLQTETSLVRIAKRMWEGE